MSESKFQITNEDKRFYGTMAGIVVVFMTIVWYLAEYREVNVDRYEWVESYAEQYKNNEEVSAAIDAMLEDRIIRGSEYWDLLDLIENQGKNEQEKKAEIVERILEK